MLQDGKVKIGFLFFTKQNHVNKIYTLPVSLLIRKMLIFYTKVL
jgi:hypothetical protein